MLHKFSLDPWPCTSDMVWYSLNLDRAWYIEFGEVSQEYGFMIKSFPTSHILPVIMIWKLIIGIWSISEFLLWVKHYMWYCMKRDEYHVSADISQLSCVWLFVTLWVIACQAPLSIEFSRQAYWSGLPFSSLEDLPSLGIEPGSPALQADSLPSELQGSSEPPRRYKYSGLDLKHLVVYLAISASE